MAKKVLLVTNRRPEDAGGRAEKVATRKRLLEEFGWEVVIGHVPEPYAVGFPHHLLSLLRKGRSEGVDAVLSINNPFHLHLHGFLSSTLLRVPWVAEFRDPILPRPDLEPGSFKWYPAAFVEWIVARFADRVLWFDGIQLADDYFETTYDAVDPAKFVGLPPMGYEKPKFENAEAVEYDGWTITYAGSFYEGWIEPYTFIEGLGTYLGEATGEEPTVRAQFYGDWDEEYDRAVQAAGAEQVVETYDFVPHEEIIPVMKGSDAVLYVGGDDPDNRRNIPSKIFDYVGARTPILAVVDPSFRVAEFIRGNGLGIVVPPGDANAVADALGKLVEEGFEYDPDPALFETFTRRRTAQDIAAALNAVTDDSTSS